MDIELKYGDGKARIPIPEKADVSILQPLRLPILESLEDSLKATLNSPLGSDALGETARKAQARHRGHRHPGRDAPNPFQGAARPAP